MSTTRGRGSDTLCSMNCDRRTPDEILMELAQRNIDAIDREIRAASVELAARERKLIELTARRAFIAKRLARIRASRRESS
jgi:hypothetical protein